MGLRRITPADIPALFEVRPRTRENALTLEQLRALGITPASVAVWLQGSIRGWLWQAEGPAEEQTEGQTDGAADRGTDPAAAGAVVGFCMADSSSAELLVLALLPRYEGRGIGGQLMQEAERWLAESGCTRAWLTTGENTALRAYGFYRHRGWTDWKIEAGVRYMQLDLRPA